MRLARYDARKRVIALRERSLVALLMMGLIVLCSACGSTTQSVTTTSGASPSSLHLPLAIYSASARVQPGTPALVSASCHPGEQMLGGGFAASDLFEYAAYIEASYPSDAMTWITTGSAPASFYDLEAEVYCAPATTPLGIQIIHTSGASATCPQGTVLLGGGFQGSEPIGVSSLQGNGWSSTTSDASTQVYALCAAHHVAPGRVVTATFNPHSTTHNYAPSGADAACPEGQIAVGGSFEGGGLIVESHTRGPSFTGWSVAAGGDADVTISAECILLQA